MSTAPLERRAPERPWLDLLYGVLAACAGLAPWWATGARLPLQNLWATERAADDMPLALLPLSQYTLPLVLGLVIVGGAAAGAIARRRGPSRRRTAVAAAGVLLVDLVCGLQALTVTGGGLVSDSRSRLYLVTLAVVVVVAAVTALLVVWAVGAGGAPVATVGWTFGALALGTWCGAWLVPPGSTPTELPALAPALRWLPAILVGVALAWCGLRSVGAAVAWLVALLALWIVPAGLTAVSYATGSRVLLRNPLEAVGAGLDVFGAALGPDGGSLVTLPVTIVIGLAGLALRRVLQRTGTPASARSRQPADDQHQ